MNRKHSRMTLGCQQMDDAGGDSCVRLIIKTSKSSKKRRSQVRVGSEQHENSSMHASVEEHDVHSQQQ